jgi:hypothetical protein
MPKVSWNSTHCTYSNTDNSGAIMLSFTATGRKIILFLRKLQVIFFSWPQHFLLFNIIDFYVERVKKTEKITKNCGYLCHRESCLE